ncbi:MAG: hypothetical protein ACE5GE_07350 [Phycisphaerae bacterium]
MVILDEQAREDVFLWERGQRLAGSVAWIASLADVAQDALDPDALLAAALYHDSGWAIQCRDGEIPRSAVLTSPTSDVQRDLAAALVQNRLADVLGAASIKRAAETIRLASRHATKLVEAQVLADALSLDEIGTISVWQIVRRHALEGKGVREAIINWQTRNQYDYWGALIRNMHFSAVKTSARRRLLAAENYMAELAREHCGQDLSSSGVSQESTSKASS